MCCNVGALETDARCNGKRLPGSSLTNQTVSGRQNVPNNYAHLRAPVTIPLLYRVLSHRFLSEFLDVQLAYFAVFVCGRVRAYPKTRSIA